MSDRLFVAVPLTRFRIRDIVFINSEEARTVKNRQKWLPFLEEQIYSGVKQWQREELRQHSLIYWSEKSLGGTLEEVLGKGEEGV